MERHRGPHRTLLAAATIVALLGLCVSPRGVEAQGGKPEVTSIKLGTAVMGTAFITTYVAERNGFFEKHGVKVEVSPFQGGPKAIQALLAGEVQVFEGDFPPILSAYASGEDLVVFAQTVVPPIYKFFGRKGIDSWQKLADAKGVVGVSAIGGIDHIMVRYTMMKAGVNPGGVRFIAAGTPLDRANALIAGRLDLIAATAPGYFILQEKGLPMVGQLSDALDRLPLEQFGTTRKFHDAHPNTIRALVAAHREAAEWTRQNRQAAVDILMKVIKGKPEQRELQLRALDEYGPYLAPKGVTEEGYRLITQAYVDEGRLKEPVDTVLGKLLTFWKKP